MRTVGSQYVSLKIWKLNLFYKLASVFQHSHYSQYDKIVSFDRKMYLKQKLYLYWFVSIIAINLISGKPKSDINLQKIYQNVEAKLEEQLKQKMLNGSTSSYHSKRRSNHMWVKVGYGKALETGIIILVNQVTAVMRCLHLDEIMWVSLC